MKILSDHEMSKMRGGEDLFRLMAFLEFTLFCIKNGLTTFEWNNDSWVCY